MNFIGTFALTKALMPLLTKNEGRIVNVTLPYREGRLSD